MFRPRARPWCLELRYYSEVVQKMSNPARKYRQEQQTSYASNCITIIALTCLQILGKQLQQMNLFALLVFLVNYF